MVKCRNRGCDPRKQFVTAAFYDSINEIENLESIMNSCPHTGSDLPIRKLFGLTTWIETQAPINIIGRAQGTYVMA